jgi:murein DD-endopeptidase MepM/ murein hydrolase activator NlpD
MHRSPLPALVAVAFVLASISGGSRADEPLEPRLVHNSTNKQPSSQLLSTTRAWIPPLTGRLRVVRGFEPAASAWGRGHRGVDLAARPGTAIRSAGPGVVIFARTLAGRGVVSVEHAPGVRTTYEPVRATIAEGSAVVAGTPLGYLTSGGHNPGSLHWGLRIHGSYGDPLRLLRNSPVLKPTTTAWQNRRHMHRVPLTLEGEPG